MTLKTLLNQGLTLQNASTESGSTNMVMIKGGGIFLISCFILTYWVTSHQVVLLGELRITALEHEFSLLEFVEPLQKTKSTPNQLKNLSFLWINLLAKRN